MERWRAAMVLVALIVLGTVGAAHLYNKRVHRKREVAYQAVLQEFSRALAPGMTRDQVEQYLHARNLRFDRTCCAETQFPSNASYDELTKIGQEDAPWYCSRNNIYLAFHFSGRTRDTSEPDPADKFTAVKLYPRLECL
jgi:hypothetical protein